MPKIENVGIKEIIAGHHFDCGDNAMLIQIMDTGTFSFPKPKHNFKEFHRFEFMDIGDDAGDMQEAGCSEYQAVQLVNLLKHALANDMNVVVHCHAGICRSGAVVEVATMMGFEDTERRRIPNTRVKRLMMKELGLTYDSTNDIYAQIERKLNE